MSHTPSTDVLTPRQLAFIAERLPEPPQARTGRPHYTNHELLPGILRVLRSGCRWRAWLRRGSGQLRSGDQTRSGTDDRVER